MTSTEEANPPESSFRDCTLKPSLSRRLHRMKRRLFLEYVEGKGSGDDFSQPRSDSGAGERCPLANLCHQPQSDTVPGPFFSDKEQAPENDAEVARINVTTTCQETLPHSPKSVGCMYRTSITFHEALPKPNVDPTVSSFLTPSAITV